MLRTALVVSPVIFLAGCMVSVDNTGPTEHFQQSIDAGKSEQARVEIKLGVGELHVDGGAAKLMDADIDYNIPGWKPNIHYDSSSFRGDLLIEQPAHTGSGSHAVYKWNLRLSDTMPIDFVTHLGVGEAHLNLGSMNLRSVEVHMGVGQAEVDLRGKPMHDYNVEIHGGIGQAVVHLPANVGIVANAKGGIGNIEVHGLEKRGGQWVNTAHENSPVTIHLDVKGGIGNITLTAE